MMRQGEGLDGEAIERVGHHLSSALTVITGHAELLINSDSGHHVRVYAAEILQAAQRVQQYQAELKELCLSSSDG